ncbi:hypothetical protein CBR_g30364 [Chara braunii]|uniref:LOB domain-containing protein n=1 Tax=Chara braunii TaxID=69332 RepID=A0A388JX81_CHABU|nr:hypothetical protein CBR_g30364 [Chara braunii]|eukprot:GBG62410.1 hypothetical protein CBR_g30364 [Chara braunii]
MGSSAISPCAACKFLRRKCTSECLFAPYFPPDQPQKFANVHKIFGASNITKLLHDLPVHQREDAVNSLAYEADARVKDPVYGCVGAISVLQQQVAHLQAELAIAHAEIQRLHNAAANSGSIPVSSKDLLELGAGGAGGSYDTAFTVSDDALRQQLSEQMSSQMHNITQQMGSQLAAQL